MKIIDLVPRGGGNGGGGDSGRTLSKENIHKPAFVKTGAEGISLRAGTSVKLEDKVFNYHSEEVVTLNGLAMGEDYAVFVLPNGTLQAVHDPFEAPASPPTLGAIQIGGFHYGLVDKDETLAGGEFATSGAGHIWTQEDVNAIRGINKFSLWDLNFRGDGIVNIEGNLRNGKLSNHGFVFDPATKAWVGIYFCSTDTDTYGLSRAGTDIASGTVAAKVPKHFGGDGTTKRALDWWAAQEILQSQGARFSLEREFNSWAFGVTERTVAGGAEVTYPITERIKKLTSRLGIEQATGVGYVWGGEVGYRRDASDTFSMKDVVGGRGKVYTAGTYGLVRSLFGGARTNDPSHVGSRFSNWGAYPWFVNWILSVRPLRDHLNL